jgi:transcriptional regulator with XRE-family HTH domain
MSGNPSLAQLLRELRESRGISARRIEQLGGPSRRMLGEYEAGSRVPTEATVLRILQVLEVPPQSPQAVQIMDVINPRVGLTVGQYREFVDAMVELVLKTDGRPRTEVLVLNARNDVLAIMRRTIGETDGGSDAQK